MSIAFVEIKLNKIKLTTKTKKYHLSKQSTNFEKKKTFVKQGIERDIWII